MKDKKLQKKDDWWCEDLPDNMTDCLKQRIRKDMGPKGKGTECFGKYDFRHNNCTDYTNDMLADCSRNFGGEAMRRERY
jgi:hypothetical protein